jgi:hypothetical protein
MGKEKNEYNIFVVKSGGKVSVGVHSRLCYYDTKTDKICYTDG